MTELPPMDETATPPDNSGTPPPPAPPRRSPGHRGQDVRDTVAELAARAHEISLEAGSKMASALKDVIGAAAGISAFAVESARDLVQYFVRRGQMTPEEAEKLLREAEEASQKKGRAKEADAGRKPTPAAPVRAFTPTATKAIVAKPVPVKAAAAPKPKPAAKKPAPKKAAPAKAAKKVAHKK